MLKRKDVLTTGQVAEICNVAPRTVTKWFDSGRLKGYRIPGSKDRRIPASELLKFMKAHEMPTEGLELGSLRILIIDSDWETADSLAESLRDRKNYEVHTATNSFDAGLAAQKLEPHAILINFMSRDLAADHITNNIRSNEELSTARIIAIAGGLNDSEAQALLRKGYDAVVNDKTDLNNVINTIESVTAIVY